MFTKKPCETCEFLKLELYKAQDLNNRLLERLLTKPEVISEVEHELPQPIGNKYIPWHIKKQQLERDDALKYKALQDAQIEYKNTAEVYKETEQLENELL
jgi:hypothetical protein